MKWLLLTVSAIAFLTVDSRGFTSGHRGHNPDNPALGPDSPIPNYKLKKILPDGLNLVNEMGEFKAAPAMVHYEPRDQELPEVAHQTEKGLLNMSNFQRSDLEDNKTQSKMTVRSGDCPPGTVNIQGQCLEFVRGSRRTCYSAKATCAAKGATLASLTNPEAVLQHASQFYPGDSFWVGGSDYGNEGNWKWITGSSIPTTYPQFPWGAGEPNNWSGNEHCLQMVGKSRGFNDNNCNRKYGHVCDDTSLIRTVKKFAPLLRFDSKFGREDLCFPSSAAEYYNARKAGNQGRICNRDYNSIKEGRVPTYWKAQKCGKNLYIAYWFFYGYQSPCFASIGKHDADWEHIYVKVLDYGSSLARNGGVQFYQHNGYYTLRNRYTTYGTHPRVYVGKIAHGSYHDEGGRGGCLYFWDYRKPGAANMMMQTWLNLEELDRGEGKPAFMNDQTNQYFNDIPQPLNREETSHMCELKGCRLDGCLQTDIDVFNF